MTVRFFLTVLLIFISFGTTRAQQNNDVKVLILSQDIIGPIKIDDLPRADVKVNLRIKNDGQRDIYIFGSKDKDGFESEFHLVRYMDSQGKWTVPSVNWELVPDDDRAPYRLKSGANFDFSSIFSRADTKKRFKAAVYYGYTKKGKPMLIESNEFFVEGIRSSKK